MIYPPQGPRINIVRADRADPATRAGTYPSYAIVDMRRLHGIGWGQLADYLALVLRQ